MAKITGITKSSLWKAWKNIRKQLSRSSIRDVTDFVEYDIDPDWWIKRLLQDLKEGNYEPADVCRFTIAKKMGFSRQMAQPSIPDLVLFRAAVDLLYKKAEKYEKKHVYFAQNKLSKKVKQIQEEFDGGDATYTFISGSAFLAWLKYEQYRKHLLLDKIYPYIVITDITNYFDTILYNRVVDTLHEIHIDRNLAGLVFFILERLSYRDSFNESPRIGLPVDEFDCSRTLAHMVLFPHDRRMTKLVGEGAYVRWMDDQNFGANTYAEGLRILQGCGHSLRRLHLTPNASKSRVLSLAHASRHFHFDINATLDGIGKMPRKTQADHQELRKELIVAWKYAKKYEAQGGEWGKVLKRFYRLAGISQARFLRSRAKCDILKEPSLANRISDYIRVTSAPNIYYNFVCDLLSDHEQVYPDVNYILIEGFLKVEASSHNASMIRKLASDLLAEKYDFPGWQRCTTLAPLVILRFGDRRSLRTFRRIVNQLDNVHQPAIGKSVVAVYASYGKMEYKEVVKSASKLRDNYLAHFIKMLDASQHYKTVPDRFKIRRNPIYDPVSDRKRLDIRKLLVLRLLRLNKRKAVQKWLDDALHWITKQKISDFDKKLAKKLLKP